jgi:mono/diheme cytochrome c family protein
MATTGVGMHAQRLVMAWMATVAAAATASGCASTSQDVPSPAVESGPVLYAQHCASCHGEKGRGDGPAAKSMAATVPDLTQIATRRGGRFPREEIARVIDGLSPFTAHGSREMPVWGYEFFDPRLEDAAAEALAAERVNRLVEFLDSIQLRKHD